MVHFPVGALRRPGFFPPRIPFDHTGESIITSQLIIANEHELLILSGEGDVLQPDDGIASIGSGSPYATAAARALVEHTNLDPIAIVKESMRIASELCIFTNERITILSLPNDDAGADGMDSNV